ncbi:MAG: type IV secretory system conjugative DNA transfer family protein, partial [Endozoicomonas sp.]
MKNEIGANAPGRVPIKEKLGFTIIFLGTLFFFTSFAISQYLADQFNYHSTLGTPWFGQTYGPFAWFSWDRHWGDQYPELFAKAYGFLGLSFILVILIGTVFYIGFSRRSKAVLGLHGTAHWASLDEIQEAGLLPKEGQASKDGVYVGAYHDKKTKKTRYLKHNGPEHVLAFAPTRSGKGVGLVIPTLLSWKGSVICYDIKGENWALTAGWRKTHANNKVLRFEPTSSDDSGVCFNPLAEIRIGQPEEVGD